MQNTEVDDDGVTFLPQVLLFSSLSHFFFPLHVQMMMIFRPVSFWPQHYNTSCSFLRVLHIAIQ